MTYKYRVTNTIDPEERLEDAAMAKAMHDVFGDQIEIVSEGKADFGRDRMFSGPRLNIAYWNDPAFIAAAARDVKCCSLAEAEAEVARLHGEGKDAFIKSCDLKLFTARVPVGKAVDDTLGDYIWSVLDRPSCILVQPFCDVRWEARFVSVGRQIVTFSPVGYWLTPLNKMVLGDFLETPTDTKFQLVPYISLALHNLAKQVAETCSYEDVIIDCAMINGAPGVIEFNPFSLGNFGLYACDPHKIAQAVFAKLNNWEAMP